jgi:hypothetical protein
MGCILIRELKEQIKDLQILNAMAQDRIGSSGRIL